MKNLLLLTILIFSLSPTFAQAPSSYPFEVVQSGTGDKAILFIPGFACSGNVWNDTKTVFESEYSCYTLTMAGFADTAPKPNASFESWVDGIANYIKSSKIGKVVLIGHSMGGGLAMAIAADYPELVEKVVIVDALPCLAALVNPDFKQQENLDCSESISQFSSISDERFLQMQKMSVSQLVATTEMVDRIVNWSLASNRKTFAKMYCDFSNTDLREKIATVQCPTLVLLESPFRNFKPAIERQYQNLKSADLRYANKGLHFIMYDDKEWFLEQLSSFITLD